jgi:hypothetical protein
MRRFSALRSLSAVALLGLSVLSSGCEQLGIESPQKIAEARQADGRAVGGACRHAGRAIEDCYLLNKRADKAAVFAGWRDMNDYMRENQIEVVPPVLSGKPAEAPVDEEVSTVGGKKIARASAR